MKCIKCGAEVKSEFKICPYCGEPIQMVPDYSIYDEDDINFILEETKDVTSIKNKAYEKEQREKKEMAKRKAATHAKKRKQQNMLVLIGIACVLIVVIIVGSIVMVNNSNASSYSYQMKQADSAMFKGDIETAEKYYLKALSLSPDDLDVRLELADLYWTKGDKSTAINYLDEAVERDPSNLVAYRLYYKIYANDNDTDAIIELLDGVTDSKILDIFSEYVIERPRFSEDSGLFTSAFKLTITANQGSVIYYTTDGSDPIESGTEYIQPIEFVEAGEHIVKAVAKNRDGNYSEVVTETYEIEFAAPELPVVNPNGGNFTSTTYIYITVPTGCTSYYTWDRTDPTISSNVYTSPLLVPDGYNILSVILVDNNSGLQSEIYRGAFEYIR